jgi:hypothetical protein
MMSFLVVRPEYCFDGDRNSLRKKITFLSFYLQDIEIKGKNLEPQSDSRCKRTGKALGTAGKPVRTSTLC